MLTDGAVSQPGEVIKTAKNGSDEARVHSFGVGYGCSKYLVKEVAKAGRGSYSFVDEKQTSMLSHSSPEQGCEALFEGLPIHLHTNRHNFEHRGKDR